MPGPALRELQVVTGTVDASGTVTLVFTPPPDGWTVSGSVTVPDSPNTTEWLVGYGPSPRAAPISAFFTGKGPFGTVQLWAPDTLILAAAGLTVGSRQRGVLIGAAQSSAEASPQALVALGTPINFT